MPPSQGIAQPQPNTSVSPRGSTTPLIPADQRQASQQNDGGTDVDGGAEERDPKTGKRRFFGLGKKKEDKEPQNDMPATTAGAMPQHTASTPFMPPASPKKPLDLKPHSYSIPISPGMVGSPSRLRSSSPRMHSPASSEIFERNVQEPVQISSLQSETPAHIPTHVITEDHIPPALEASANAITSENLNADEVEIVMSTSHQPAAASVIEGSSSHADLTQLHSPLSSPLQQVRSEDSGPSAHQSGFLPPGTEDDGASNYGQLDPNDVRRLSFISFADVVQSEHQQAPTSALGEAGSRDSLHIASLPSSWPQDRAASPLRSPRSPTSTHSHSISGGLTTPPPGVSVPAVNTEQSPARSANVGSPVSPHGELTIETMRQAVRKTTSGDLSAGRNAGMSPVSDETSSSAPRSRTNT